MSNWLYKKKDSARRINWLALDSWIDSSIYDSWEDFKNRWASISSFFGRFKVTGYKRILVEFSSEGLTLGTAGMAVMLALALPAFEETNNAWHATGKYSVTFLDRSGKEIGKRGILHDDAVPLEEIPDHMIKALLSTEDRRFYEHFGIDFFGTARAMYANFLAKDVVQGGSSLSQQLAKNLFLSSERSLQRKIKEAFLALWLEARLTKNEILKLYLDRAYMGGGTFGAEAASQFYFGKSIREVTLAESAMLAGLFKAPTKYAPHVDLAASRARANEVLSNMVEAGFMTEGQVHGARLNPAVVLQKENISTADWFLDWAFEEIQRIMKGKGDFVLTAHTTVDTGLQRIAETAVQTTLRQTVRVKSQQAALIAMETDGAVRAIVGGRDYGESQFNRATHARRQPGSSFKPYVFLTALEHGYRPNSRVVDGPVSCGRWSPKNYSGGYRGAMTMGAALMRSSNTVAVKLSLRVGRDKVLKNVQKMGIKGVRKSCSMALGDTGITPLEHTAGYAVFASGGKAIKPYGILEIRNSKEEVVFSHKRDVPPPKQIFKREKIEQLNSMLGLVVTSGTGRRALLDFTTAAGKTGTSSSYRDAWFMGFTGQYVTGVWFGRDNFLPMARVTGGSLPAMTWNKFMSVSHPSPDIPQIPGLAIHPKQIEIVSQLARLKTQDPTLGGITTASNRMPQETRKVLRNLADLLRGRIKQSTSTQERLKQNSSKAKPPSLQKSEKPKKGQRRSRLAQPNHFIR